MRTFCSRDSGKSVCARPCRVDGSGDCAQRAFEMGKALKDVRNSDLKIARETHQKPVTDFLLRWGTEMTLTLTIDEKSSVAPNLTWLPPSAASSVFSLGGGLGGSADATR